MASRLDNIYDCLHSHRLYFWVVTHSCDDQVIYIALHVDTCSVKNCQKFVHNRCGTTRPSGQPLPTVTANLVDVLCWTYKPTASGVLKYQSNNLSSVLRVNEVRLIGFFALALLGWSLPSVGLKVNLSSSRPVMFCGAYSPYSFTYVILCTGRSWEMRNYQVPRS